MKNIKLKKVLTAGLAAVLLTFSMIGCANTQASASTEFPSIEETAEAELSSEESGYETLFEKDKVLDIHVDVAEEDWESMLSDPLAEEYKSASVTVDGVKVENVGFRTKGNSTLRSVADSDSDRYSFRIKLDKYVEDQSLLGLDEFVLNNMYSDASYMREYLSYEALREIGADVPLTTFVNIYINGELYGFYLCVEAPDDSFVERNFEDSTGNLYKQEQGSTLQYEEGSEYEKSELKLGEDETKTDLKAFIKILNEMPSGEKGNIEEVLDVESALKYIAANTVLGNYDSYSGNMSHNYYLYGQDGKFTVIPWDYNMSIAGFGGGGSQTTIPIDEPVSGVNIDNLPLIKNLLAVEEYKEKYHGYIEELLNYLDGFEGRVENLADLIRPYVEADPTKFYTMEQFEAAITYSETQEASMSNIPQAASTEVQNESSVAQEDPQTPTSGQMQPPNDQQMPPNGEGMQAPPDFPEGFQNGDRPERPEGNENGDRPERGEGMRGGPGGGMMGSSGSIINFVRERIENITAQLAGELPT
ncbi:MAG: spore coat protein CotH, partial [Clostridia bacterium]|nr:spore coat protein CotH [Clostridia bacterium]